MVFACVGLAAAWTPPPATAGVRPPTVTVEDQGSVSDVRGRFDVPVLPSVAWGVLTDYDHIADFVSSVRTSAVESRVGSGFTVRQEAVVGAFPFRRVAHLLLRVREQPDQRIEFHDLLERDFRLYQGEWELRPGLSGTAVTYRLQAQPVRSIPRLVDHAVLSRTVLRLLAQVQTEMIRRGGAGGSLSSAPPAP
jgi:hypothetical protein